jgi:hypothetical protein
MAATAGPDQEGLMKLTIETKGHGFGTRWIAKLDGIEIYRSHKGLHHVRQEVEMATGLKAKTINRRAK